VMQVIHGPDDLDSTAQQELHQYSIKNNENEKYRIGYFKQWLDHPSIDPEISAAIKQYIKELSEKGHTITALDFDLTEFIVPAYYILTTAEASSNLSRYDGIRYGIGDGARNQNLAGFYTSNRSLGFGAEVKRRIMLGSFVLSAGYFDAYYTKAQKIRKLLSDNTKLIFKDLDFIIAPNSPNLPPALAEKPTDPLAISLPVFKHSSNLCFGLQVASSEHNEVSLLRFTHQLMQQ
jgi:aspartyl-tRNA(Asn)/glutamyl-tRNA(Gln) amidotransferase subunit A